MDFDSLDLGILHSLLLVFSYASKLLNDFIESATGHEVLCKIGREVLGPVVVVGS